jgi:hypothetical protein
MSWLLRGCASNPYILQIGYAELGCPIFVHNVLAPGLQLLLLLQQLFVSSGFTIDCHVASAATKQ